MARQLSQRLYLGDPVTAGFGFRLVLFIAEFYGGFFSRVQHYGSTDPLVILNTLEHYGIPQEVFSYAVMCRFF
jgi:hypothetical protein